jgi:hypothetical protein
MSLSLGDFTLSFEKGIANLSQNKTPQNSISGC